MGNIEIKKMVLGMVSTNSYIVSNKMTKEAIIVDPAADSDRLLEYIKLSGCELKAILLTHGHYDHIGAIEGILREKQVPVYCEESEMELLQDDYLNLSTMIGNVSYAVPSAKTLKDGQEIELASFPIKVIHTPGHTKGGACYYFMTENCLFSGDTLFFESVGRTDFPTGSAVALINSIREKLYLLKDDCAVYPGHGPSTSIGYEKENNPYTLEEGLWD